MRNFFLNQFYTNMRGGQRNLNLILDNIYPIGSIHLTVGDYNPSIYFGGNWQKISGGFLWGCNTSVDNNLMNSSVGHTKSFDTTLTVNQMPSHTHTQNSHSHGIPYRNDGGPYDISLYFSYSSGNVKTWWNSAISTGGTTAINNNTGGGQGHSHDIPHIGVWVWKRIS